VEEILPPPKLLPPPHALPPSSGPLTAALSVVEFLHTFRHALPGMAAVEAAGVVPAECVLSVYGAGPRPLAPPLFAQLQKLYTVRSTGLNHRLVKKPYGRVLVVQ
jgi:hypothetical protein